jgi:hypothetical protein
MAEEPGPEHPVELSPETLARLRRLAHDLSNSLETIVQASYLMAQSKLEAKNKQLLGMLDQAAQEAVHINRSLREILRSQSEQQDKSRAS